MRELCALQNYVLIHIVPAKSIHMISKYKQLTQYVFDELGELRASDDYTGIGYIFIEDTILGARGLLSEVISQPIFSPLKTDWMISIDPRRRDVLKCISMSLYDKINNTYAYILAECEKVKDWNIPVIIGTKTEVAVDSESFNALLIARDRLCLDLDREISVENGYDGYYYLEIRKRVE